MKTFYGSLFVLNTVFAGLNLYFGAQGYSFNLAVGVFNAIVATGCFFVWKTESA